MSAAVHIGYILLGFITLRKCKGMCNSFPKRIICSSTQGPYMLPCREANDRHLSRQSDLFCCTWSLFVMVLAVASTLSPQGTIVPLVLQPRKQQSDKQCRHNPGQIWGCVWYASPWYNINTRLESSSACLNNRREGFPTLPYMP